MGILCQPVLNNTARYADLPVPSVRMALLFYEFLGRYKEWKNARFQETIGILLILFLGLCLLFIPWFWQNIGVLKTSALFVLFYFAVRYYLSLSKRVSHLYVNVYILHHHLVGKLEVGFCDHIEPCHCVENFRQYVLQKYKISLNRGFLS